MINRVTLLGHLGNDPEVKHLDSGKTVANFSIATTESWKDKNGEKQSSTEWHNVVAWEKLAEIVEKWLSKGSLIYLEGKLTTRSWEDKDGNTRYTTEVLANTIKMLGGKNGEAKKEEPEPVEETDDLPF